MENNETYIEKMYIEDMLSELKLLNPNGRFQIVNIILGMERIIQGNIPISSLNLPDKYFGNINRIKNEADTDPLGGFFYTDEIL